MIAANRDRHLILLRFFLSNLRSVHRCKDSTRALRRSPEASSRKRRQARFTIRVMSALLVFSLVESAVVLGSQPIQERNIQRRIVKRITKRGSLCPTFFAIRKSA